jgi:hypothetical protein
MKSRILCFFACVGLLAVFACDSGKGGLPKNIVKEDPDAKMKTAPTPKKMDDPDFIKNPKPAG